ncbi:DUF5647 family protein [Thermus scotoductus]|uniref:DUF5647 family protein n=1 Tax=Thermus scotoductus TaxID=37636 RepID=UPI001561F017|nr:DUF5647 family protein [Thermus scotoductus]
MVDAAQRLAELDGILTDLLGEAHLLGELPQAYRLVPLPLDEPEVAAKALAWAREAPNPEGWPPVYALFLQGREVEIGAQAAPEPEAGLAPSGPLPVLQEGLPARRSPLHLHRRPQGPRGKTPLAAGGGPGRPGVTDPSAASPPPAPGSPGP